MLRACHDRNSSSRLSYDRRDVGARATATATASESADYTASSSGKNGGNATAFKPFRRDRQSELNKDRDCYLPLNIRYPLIRQFQLSLSFHRFFFFFFFFFFGFWILKIHCLSKLYLERKTQK
ncbi:uncharacterized protein UBRO_20737 [Ustilago bromivora]|uniref:Uncharacterized protein n=1 Tax=Ustilago bromivora TaxID=307758 RepID=A0A1K0H967_9BASI|nr:uncharacterized protein UBRO_20737 [Ustilago bromivora]